MFIKKLTGKEVTFFEMDNDHNDLKFISIPKKSSRQCFEIVYYIIKLCKENKSKCTLDNVPDLTHENAEDELQKICRFSNAVNKHMDLERFYLSLKSRLEAIPDHPDHDDFKKMDMTDVVNEMMYGVSTSKVGAAFCRHLLVEGYQNVFKNEKLTKNDLKIYRESLYVAILCTIKTDLIISKRDSFDDIEQYINDNLVNGTVKKNLDSVLGKMTNFHKSPIVNAFRYRLESMDHRRDDRVTLIKKSNEPHKGLQILDKVN
jgi:hypothetical protein